MAWVKLDDQFADHPKVLAAGPLAAWLYVAGLCYSARQLTDGFIPTGMARRLADVPDVEAAIAALVDAELWDVAEGGYRIHDYLEYQPSKDRVLATRDARADAGSRGGKQKASNLVERGYEHVASKTVPRTHPVPVPVSRTPTPSPNGADAPSRAQARGREWLPRFERFWLAYPRKEVKAKAREWFKERDPTDEDVDAMVDAIARQSQSAQWQKEGGRFIPMPTTWLHQRRWEDEGTTIAAAAPKRGVDIAEDLLRAKGVIP